jgi:hypothetical protein
VVIAGPFPGNLQQDLVFVARLPNRRTLRRFSNFLKLPEAAAVFKAKGVTPG